jgi:thiol-disulfide isomerase/thioredoxin
MRIALLLALAATAGCGAAPSAPAEPADLPAIRGPAGQIALITLDGAPTTLAAHGAKVTVVALWATYCLPCIEELPHLNALHHRYRGRPDVSIIAVNLDDTSDPWMRGQVRELLDSLGVDMPCLLGGDAVMERLTARDEAGRPRLALPLLAVVDAAFRIHRHFGFQRGIPREQYVAEKSALVEAALRGDEPLDSPPPAFSR